jgi:hypothetical protein
MTACPSPETASLLVKASAAQLVVIASRAEHERTHTLLRQLRAKEATRSLPILVLGPEDLRPTLAESNDIDLLTLPAFVRDVLTASEMIVAAGATAAQKPGEEPCFEAPLTSVRTLSIVRSMNGLSRSGHLRLEHNGRVGELLFHQGELTAASVGPLQAMAAVQHLMVWNEGKLELRLRQVPRRGQLRLSASEFLLELDRFQREYAHAMKEIGPAATVYAASQERMKQAGGAIPAEVTPVVRLCDGKRALSDIIDESPFRVLDSVRILGRLADLGILTRADGKPVGIAGAPRAADDEFLDSARIDGSAQAWPMPEPIASFPIPEPFSMEPTPQPQAAPASKPDAEVTPPPVKAPPKEGERPRRQTRELGVPITKASRTGKTPAPVAAAKPATPASVAPVATTPTAPAPVARVTRAPVAPVTPAPVTPAPVAQVTPAPVAPRATKPPAPATPAPVAARGGAMASAPTAAARPAGPVATLMQTSGAVGSKAVPPSLAAKPAPPAAPSSGAISGQPAAAAPVAAAAAPGSVPAAPFPLATAGLAGAAPAVTSPSAPASGILGAKPAASPTATARFAAPAPPATASSSGVVVQPLASPATGPNAAGSVTQMAGILESRKGERRSQQNLRAVSERSSVVVEAMAAEFVKTPLPATSSSSNLPHASVPSPVPEEIPPGRASARITGVLQVAPSRRSAGQATPLPRASIQLDASLSEPSKAAAPTSPGSGAAVGGRVTGEMHTVSSGRSTRSMGKTTPAPSSFQIDPSLSAKVERTPEATAPRRSDSRPIPGIKRRASGSFSAVESDFFEREADLYKEETPESFADLDSGKAKPDNRPGHKPAGKPGRPYRR